MTKQPVIIVTEGTSALGARICKEIAATQSIVIALSTDENAGYDLVASDPRVRFRQANSQKESDVRAVLEEVEAQFGRLDALVYNPPSTPPGHLASFHELDLFDWNQALHQQLTAAVFSAQLSYPLLKSSQGAIVNVIPTPNEDDRHSEVLSVCSQGLIGLSESLANSLAPSVRVHAVCHYLNRSTDEKNDVNQYSDVAAMVRFLVSKETAHINGQVFKVTDRALEKKHT
ncbi:SDR family NAD(P)-dependent oxidoreductase [Photobacterium sp. 1_MG-2023]|uniref:SDR family NAD(P)-dependent oxidoreductase n=1 Tax=Photobacterium sp. 1_MG-2023 TaxID=3062646 RepID=UPI0026E28326|nr:SDR family oxidoreductase [Photobacterium sp. 1_MG-2023]MDO6705340.1 SDR family oxidoreductase [Photobacterium sp. 1_MG-2023]